MKHLKAIGVLAVTFALVSCSPVKVVVDQNEEADFSSYQTFSFQSWQDVSDEIFSERDKEIMREAFINEFNRRGLTLVNAAGDMQVSLYVVVNNETAFSGYNDYVGGRTGSYSHYGGGWGYGYNGNTIKQRDELVGTLIMNVYNGSSRNQIWQAIATGTVNENPRTRDKTIPERVSTIMRRFPIRPQ